MKKHIYVCIFLLIFIILFAACSKKGARNDMEATGFELVNNFDHVSMEVKKEGLSSKGITLIFENNSDKNCIYGEFFSLEKSIDGKWYGLPVVVEGDYGFNDIGYKLNPGEVEEFQVKWEWLYGSIENGHYRIVKDISDFRGSGDFDVYYLAAEFTISD